MLRYPLEWGVFFMEGTKICKSFKFLSANLEKIVNKKLKEKDLSITQGLVLLWLNEESSNQLPIKTIEKKFGTAQSTTLGVINRLEQKKLVATCLSEHRTKIVKMTQDGLALVAFIETYVEAADDMVLDGFSCGEKMLFFELLKRAEHNLLQQHDIEMEEYYE